MYQYTDFPWPDSVTEEFPNNRQVADYLNAYARHFGVLECIRFGHRVAGMEYVGVAEEEVAAWDDWAGCGDAFGSGNGKWRLTVTDAQGLVQVHMADFVILCIGRFSNVPNIPKLPPGKGPDAFDGKVIHSLDYSKMGSQKAKEMVKQACLFLSLLATTLTPLKLMFSKFAESYYSITMKKHDMVPDHSFFEGIVGGWVELAPKDHYKNLEEGSILVKKSKTFSFCKEGVMVEGESTLVKSDIVLLGTGFKGDQNIKNMFASKYFQRILIGSISMDVSLYRDCVHPKIPQLAVIGYSETYANLHTSELRAKWLAHFMDGGFRLPSVKAMHRDALEWEKFLTILSWRILQPPLDFLITGFSMHSRLATLRKECILWNLLVIEHQVTLCAIVPDDAVLPQGGH
ncbi:hypothetical protein ZWY2020_057299 [Hordeum vulgare]|nr:hypothetical protein ZWY2020_057299 [Hordeum vulgare]